MELVVKVCFGPFDVRKEMNVIQNFAMDHI